MKNPRSAWLAILLIGTICLLAFPFRVSAHNAWQQHSSVQAARDQQAEPTPYPAAIPDPSETPESRVLPAVGSNAGLVLGAMVLVLIIIGGVVIASRWRSKH